MGVPLNESAVLSCNPFDGDYGGSGAIDRVLKDRMVTARKPGPCHLCLGTIKPGERARSRAEVYDGELMSFRWCEKCCRAMAKSLEDDGDAYEARAEIGARRQRKSKEAAV